MSGQRGICMNCGRCSNADQSKPIIVPSCAPFICPECHQPLQSSPDISGRRNPIKLIISIFALVAICFGLFSFFSSTPSAPARNAAAAPAPAKSNAMLRFAGSNTIGSELLPALAEAYLRKEGAAEVTRTPGKNAEEITIADSARPEAAIEIKSHGSSTAFKALLDRSADIGMSSRKIKGDEITKLAALGDVTQSSREHVLALDGIAIIVHRDNPLSSLSKDQIGAIFSGVITDWAELKRKPGKITLYARDEKSGTWDTFKSVVLGNLLLDVQAKRFEDSNELSIKVAQDVNAIGFVGLPFVRNNKALAVSDADAAPLIATRLTVATEDYPLSRRLYLYTPDTNTNPHVRKFTEFALSRAGQDIVKQYGFIELNVESSKTAAAAAPQSGMPTEYARLTAGAQRLSLNFRFMSGSHRLDNKAVRDLDRVLEFIGNAPGQRVMLFGFSDAQGDASANLNLSRERSKAVAEELLKRGVKIDTIAGYGATLPVAGNQSAEGRDKNRRVEIWVKK
ncbi:MAG: serine/threonine protein kinase [Burkholderiaceae bacterium]|nr:serine/threonine protein kinase [Burkholderiaceae bacterium]